MLVQSDENDNKGESSKDKDRCIHILIPIVKIIFGVEYSYRSDYVSNVISYQKVSSISFDLYMDGLFFEVYS